MEVDGRMQAYEGSADEDSDFVKLELDRNKQTSAQSCKVFGVPQATAGVIAKGIARRAVR